MGSKGYWRCKTQEDHSLYWSLICHQPFWGSASCWIFEGISRIISHTLEENNQYPFEMVCVFSVISKFTPFLIFYRVFFICIIFSYDWIQVTWAEHCPYLNLSSFSWQSVSVGYIVLSCFSFIHADQPYFSSICTKLGYNAFVKGWSLLL